jgi:hypothetical protein
MAVRFLGYEVNGVLQKDPPEELIERVRQAFQEEYDLKCRNEEEESDEQRKAS